ncbi:hypothetical secreted protein [Pseudomonas knackmussii B13]|uniref:Hypothetical secreted protein n=1 Tax=Pseudomonas knackmussii (strain DSM 6978 / CCUG 54928 / LMG 23759 / B13) TaxID=1301098 RepID=A0A024HB50_PSEKB|nr:DUF2388 domain-containing protein [Pseudomonas knackmussii]CDF81737.1 hypothetical secreted protein [Pseudomonas knackmussii B13]
MRMTKLTATCTLLCLLPLGSAMADDFWRDVISSGATTASTYLTFKKGDKKLLVAAREDAGSYVASDGAIRGPYLEAALQRLRQDHPQLQQRSDMELANAILAEPDEPSR